MKRSILKKHHKAKKPQWAMKQFKSTFLPDPNLKPIKCELCHPFN